MNAINWQQFGLKKNPYETMPLIEGGDIDISKAFVGRDSEKKILDNLFSYDNRLCLAICGNVGVGKTSLANFQKFIWKYHQEKLLFSFRREIEANNDLLNKKSFLIEIIASVIREIRLMDAVLLKNELIKKLSAIVDISQTIEFSVGGSFMNYGLNLGGSKNAAPPFQISISFLEQCFSDLVSFIKNNEIAGNKYSGLVVHVNNFDIVLVDEDGKKKAIAFFDELRDILQTPDVYYLFLGPKNLFRDVISAKQRVKSIFYQTPLVINPLSKTDIIKAFDERMELLKSDNVSGIIKPIEDEVIYKIYDLYEGDVRSIMSCVIDILGQYSEKLAKPLSVNGAMLLLAKERWEKIEIAIKLTPEQKEILKYLAQADKYISQKEVAVMFKKAQSNVSGYYFKPLKDNNIIEEKEVKGKTSYYGLTTDYIPLKWLISSQKAVQQEIIDESSQLSFKI